MKARNNCSAALSPTYMQKGCLIYLLIKSYIYEFPPKNPCPHFEHAGDVSHRFGSCARSQALRKTV
jgi:hypothetical protein